LPSRVILYGVLVLAAVPALAQQPERVVVYGTLPDSDIALSQDKISGGLQSLNADQLTAQHGGSLLSALGSQTAGVKLSR